EVLAQEAVGVLVRPALPRAVRITEVDREPGVDAELRVLSHLGPLVPGEGPTELFGQCFDHPGDLVADGLGAVPSERWPVLPPWLLTVAFHWRKVQQLFFFRSRRPPRSERLVTLFPYPTLFR